MAKCASIGRPLFAKLMSTRIYAKLPKIDNKSRITIITKSNPGILFFFAFSFAAALVKLITYKTHEDLKLSAVYLLVAIGFFLLDRFIKNIVIGSFETDMNLRYT